MPIVLERYQDSALWAWLEFCLPLRGTNSNVTYVLSYFYRFNTFIGSSKTAAVDFLRLKGLTGTRAPGLEHGEGGRL